jgi:hypothetical protein
LYTVLKEKLDMGKNNNKSKKVIEEGDDPYKVGTVLFSSNSKNVQDKDKHAPLE